MKKNFLQGALVHLTAEDPEVMAKLFSHWSGDSEYSRLLDWEPAICFSVKNSQKWLEKDFEKENNHYFAIQALEDGKIIGVIGLDGIRWTHGDCFVGIGLGEREYWGKGYGTDAMKIILRYAFTELNLHRVSLEVFEYNMRGVRSYEKAGFIHEGRERSLLLREGKRWDVLSMGILKDDWLRRKENE